MADADSEKAIVPKVAARNTDGLVMSWERTAGANTSRFLSH
ncbi:Uncharacterised protein [Mycobacterium tuberculosis]|nr:Uncharacterised protein [Mycobacterium tuberculosis]